jgi:hypothetical protein
MPLIEILTPPDSTDPLKTQLIRDRFSWGAALVPPLWMLAHHLWLETFGWCVGALAIAVLGLYLGGNAAVWLYVLYAAWTGFAASDLRVSALRRKGYAQTGTRIAQDEMAAERDWLAETAK